MNMNAEAAKASKAAKAAKAINTLGRFCGLRDVDRLDRRILAEKYGFDQADVFVLFGGSILAGGDILAHVIQSQIAKTCVIVGGAGHTTDTLRQTVSREYPCIETAGLSEAEIFQQYIGQVHGCHADYLETKSTNCGNNITNLLDLLKEKHIEYGSMILCQDATMQNRMDAGLRKYMPDNLTIINFASYHALVEEAQGRLRFSDIIHGMWDMDRYINLLMGEIPRLQDDTNGYGPNGKGFIARVEIPQEVLDAFSFLKTIYGEGCIRN